MFVSVYHKACVENGTQNLEVPLGNSPDELGCGGSRSCPSGFTCEVSRKNALKPDPTVSDYVPLDFVVRYYFTDNRSEGQCLVLATNDTVVQKKG